MNKRIYAFSHLFLLVSALVTSSLFVGCSRQTRSSAGAVKGLLLGSILGSLSGAVASGVVNKRPHRGMTTVGMVLGGLAGAVLGASKEQNKDIPKQIHVSLDSDISVAQERHCNRCNTSFEGDDSVAFCPQCGVQLAKSSR